ncbi:MAG: ABC transporter substrate-binding protein [Marinobacter sp.]|uniref:ABC transporter substrate-binding protein n=1 Tax=Marinobacter sp. TaxID=50741 RepID=UPI00299DDFE0|nr:ABC transporter substrate-binding protein [Marinobacter sp.]MDX1756120.1 ABC transporter substrate-binding protein [Marinobacter sp.]
MIYGRKKTKPPEGRVPLLQAGLLVLVLVTGMQAGATEAGPVLTVLTWGGAYEASQRGAYFDPFTQATGIAIETVRYNGGLAPLRQHLNGGAVSWDVVDMVQADAMAACEVGLLEPFNPGILAPAPDGTPAREDFFEGAILPCAITHLVFSTVLAYDDRAFAGVKPRSVADFFDTERFPGKRALRKVPVGLLEWALLSHRVPRQQLYNLLSTQRGFDLAFRRLDQIGDQIIWWESGDQPAKWLAEGRVVMASGFNGRFFHAQTEGKAPISIIWDGQLLDYNGWAILKGTDQKLLAEQFIAFATRTEAMAALANRISYGPTRESAQRHVGLHLLSRIPMRPHLPTTDEHMASAIQRDHDWYARTTSLRERLFRDWLRENFPE